MDRKLLILLEDIKIAGRMCQIRQCVSSDSHDFFVSSNSKDFEYFCGIC